MFRPLLVLQRLQAAALGDRVREQAGRRGRGHVVAHALAAGRLAEDRDIARVAAERLGVVPHPAQRRLLVLQAVIAAGPAGPFGVQRRQREEAERAEPVVDRHDHSVAGDGERPAVVDAPRSAGEPAAMDPDHHRPRPEAGRGGRVKGQVHPILSGAGDGNAGGDAAVLGADVTRLARVPAPVPAGWSAAAQAASSNGPTWWRLHKECPGTRAPRRSRLRGPGPCRSAPRASAAPLPAGTPDLAGTAPVPAATLLPTETDAETHSSAATHIVNPRGIARSPGPHGYCPVGQPLAVAFRDAPCLDHLERPFAGSWPSPGNRHPPSRASAETAIFQRDRGRERLIPRDELVAGRHPWETQLGSAWLATGGWSAAMAAKSRLHASRRVASQASLIPGNAFRRFHSSGFAAPRS